MGFSDEERKGIKIAQEEIFPKLKNTCPKLYENYKRDAKEGIGLPESWTGNYSEDKKYEIIAKRRIIDILRSDLNFVKSVMENNLSNYSGEEISDLLVILFYFRNENPETFYRWENKAENNNIKSIHAQVKEGRFLYKYEELYQSLLDVTHKYKKNRIMEREEERAACAEFYQNYLLIEQARIRNVCEGYHDSALQLGEWTSCIEDAISVMERIERENANLLYAYFYFGVIFESMGEVLYYIYQRVAIALGIKLDMELFFSRVQKDIEEICKHSRVEYDLIQNYGIHFMMYSFRKECDVFGKMMETLREEINTGKYKDYDEKYDVSNLKGELLTIQEVREKFCEDNVERLDRFKKKYEECQKVYQWYTEHHRQTFSHNELIDLKAIYRECFIYDNIPSDISKKGMKSFFNMVEEERYVEALNMSEVEMFVRMKIRRGAMREQNRLVACKVKINFMERFYKFKKDMTEKGNMKGFYLSDWTKILLENIKCFLGEQLN